MRRLGRNRLALIGMGIASEAIYLLYFVRQFSLLAYYREDIDMGGITGHSPLGFWLFVVVFTVLFLLAIGAWAAVGPKPDRVTYGIIIGFGCVFAFTLIFVYPVTAIDLFTYVAQSRILIHYHQNPILVAPSHFPHDSIMYLTGSWMNYGSPYGPIGIVVDALPVVLGGNSLILDLVLTKGLFAVCLLLEAEVVRRILLHLNPKFALGGMLLVAWNPLLLFEIVANGHNDIVMILLASLALLALASSYLLLGVSLGAASVLIKYGSAPILPLLFMHVITRSRRARTNVWVGIQAVVVSVGLGAVAYAPFWGGAATLNRALLENGFHLQSFSSVAADAFPQLTLDSATLLGRLLFVPVYVCALWLAARRFQDLVLGVFLGQFSFLGLAAANFKIWYASWVVPYSALGNTWLRLAGLLMSYGATISAAFYAYIFLWTGNFALVNNLAYAAVFVPPLIVLLLPLIKGRERAGAAADREAVVTTR